jgi:hypothetical protein
MRLSSIATILSMNVFAVIAAPPAAPVDIDLSEKAKAHPDDSGCFPL